jgi:tRNA A58 N-methylase Trm61
VVDALDVEPLAVRVARENVERNALTTPVRVKVGTIEPTSEYAGRYDLVVANILTNVIVRLAPALVAALAPGGRLLTSGITADHAGTVRDALAAAGLTAIEHRELESWTLVEGVRRARRGVRRDGRGASPVMTPPTAIRSPKQAGTWRRCNVQGGGRPRQVAEPCERSGGEAAP